jgi:hypothetical protein
MNSRLMRDLTIVLPEDHHGSVLTIRKATILEPEHRQIYATLRIPAEVMEPIKARQVNARSNKKILAHRNEGIRL